MLKTDTSTGMSMGGLSSAFLLKSFCQKSMILNSVFFPPGSRAQRNAVDRANVLRPRCGTGSDVGASDLQQGWKREGVRGLGAAVE